MPGAQDGREERGVEACLKEIRVQRGVRVQAVSERSQDTEVRSSAPTERPEEVLVLVVVSDPEFAVGRHDFDLEDVINAETFCGRKDVVTTTERPTACSTDSASCSDASNDGEVL